MKRISEDTARSLGLAPLSRARSDSGQTGVSGQLLIKAESPTVNVEAPKVNVAAPTVNVAAPNVKVESPTVNVAAPNVKVEAPSVKVEPKFSVEPTINVEPPDFRQLSAAIAAMKPGAPPKGMRMQVKRDHRGLIESCNFTFDY